MISEETRQAEIERRKGAKSFKLAIEDDDTIREMSKWAGSLFFISKKSIVRFRLAEQIDPEVVSANMPDEQQKFLDIGCENPIVARTVIQTKQLLNCVVIDGTPEYERLIDISWEVLISLASLDAIQREYQKNLERVGRSLEEMGDDLITPSQGAVLPSIPNLNIQFRSFVLELKRAINLTSQLFPALLGWNITPGHFHKARERALRKFSAQNALAEQLVKAKPWIELTIDLRNAVEHPKPESKVEIENLRLSPTKQIHAPSWAFKDEKIRSKRGAGCRAFF